MDLDHNGFLACIIKEKQEQKRRIVEKTPGQTGVFSIYTYKLKKRYKTLFLLGWREHLAMHRSGQGLFLPHARFKKKEKASSGNVVFCIEVTYMSKN
ncbi:hypothetical protein [Bacillus sp. 491mf]|uniref:hypothetical protein n=1 Tax=Bacillus sp. 491mf TaxID=1761755 RepID=UPI001C4336C5|nr:hypothetical protein [Bacillus sp. 491mf]